MPRRFFFQAEDGIRDLTVTGVQTCALPISLRFRDLVFRAPASPDRWRASWMVDLYRERSEERRVGKECRYGRWREGENKMIQHVVHTRIDYEGLDDLSFKPKLADNTHRCVV